MKMFIHNDFYNVDSIEYLWFISFINIYCVREEGYNNIDYWFIDILDNKKEDYL